MTGRCLQGGLRRWPHIIFSLPAFALSLCVSHFLCLSVSSPSLSWGVLAWGSAFCSCPRGLWGLPVLLLYLSRVPEPGVSRGGEPQVTEGLKPVKGGSNGEG